ncbi:hypothetical protein BD310DRAFT_983047 [Dichomitus squalens]|uniref:Uncharacterized protein n=1 Tax=Dichomitus squalens TaxID=114155 RepID=A0A4Q9P8W2_9APHY|nr:hypothetical protein BD310DRAFT_983047 [Dichomitus squalens]
MPSLSSTFRWLTIFSLSSLTLTFTPTPFIRRPQHVYFGHCSAGITTSTISHPRAQGHRRQWQLDLHKKFAEAFKLPDVEVARGQAQTLIPHEETITENKNKGR